MTTEGNRIGWVLWFLWVLSTAVGWMLGFFIGFIFASIVGDSVIGNSSLGEILTDFTFGAALGSVVCLMQWLIVLRWQISRSGWWVLASAAGLALAMGAGVAVDALGNFDELLGWTGGAALGGVVTGILQWLILRGHVSRAGWWVLASTVGWGLSMAIVEAFSSDSFSGLPFGGALHGVVTGGVLVWLLRQPVQEA